MSWSMMFTLTNLWALLAWAVLLLAPRGGLSGAFVMYGGVGLLCLGYVTGVALAIPDGNLAGADLTDVAGIRQLFASDAGVALGWTHYLALDLFTGLWISQDADAKRIGRLVQTPILLLTFLAGPVGLLIWLAIRESRARAAARSGGGIR